MRATRASAPPPIRRADAAEELPRLAGLQSEGPRLETDTETSSTTLFDCVAVYLAVTQDLCVMGSASAWTTTASRAKIRPPEQMNVAIAWKDLPGFEKWLVERLCK